MSAFDHKLLTGAFYVAYIYINANFQEYIVYTYGIQIKSIPKH